jgi:hypothetical protein
MGDMAALPKLPVTLLYYGVFIIATSHKTTLDSFPYLAEL